MFNPLEQLNQSALNESLLQSASLESDSLAPLPIESLPEVTDLFQQTSLPVENFASPAPVPAPTPTPSPAPVPTPKPSLTPSPILPSSSIIPTTDPGSDPSTAYDLGVLNGSLTVQQDVGDADTIDGYTFSLSQDGDVSLLLDGLSADADLYLYDSTGQTVLAQSINSDTAADSISASLTAGTYHAVIFQGVQGANTSYTLTLSGGQTSPTGPIIPTTDPGNDPSTAYDLGVLNGSLTVQQDVGDADTIDGYTFSLSQDGDVSLLLDGLSADADLYLYDSTGQTVLAQSINSDTAADSISASLAAGTYHVVIFQGVQGANTSYNLTLSNGAVPTPGPTPPPTGEDPGNTLADAAAQTSAIFSQSQQISASDSDDFYSFTVDQSGVFSADLTGLTGDADVRLIQDINSNGQVDQGEVQAWQWERSTGSESIRSFVEAGNYFLQVNSYNSQTADYAVATNFIAAASDAQDFAIEVSFGQGSEGLSDAMRNAVVEAAEVWENVISHSSFDGSHVLEIEVGGTVQEWGPNGGVLASAGPRDGNFDAAGLWMPTSGLSNINTNPDAVAALSSNIDYFRGVMAHEFGHVLGIGTLWGSGVQLSDGTEIGRNLIDTVTGTYNANTDAGWAYGELLGTFTQTAIELTTGEGGGSDLSHWREEIFDNELMTHAAGGQREGLPLSQMTIAALNDMGWNVNYGAAESYSMPGSLDQFAELTSLSPSLSVHECGGSQIASLSIDTIGI